MSSEGYAPITDTALREQYDYVRGLDAGAFHVCYAERLLIHILEPDAEDNIERCHWLRTFMDAFPEFRVWVVGIVDHYGPWADAFKEMCSCHSRYGLPEHVPESYRDLRDAPTGQFRWLVKDVKKEMKN